MKRTRLWVLLVVMQTCFFGSVALADEAGAAVAKYQPTRYSLSVSGGGTYFPDSSVGFAQVTLAALLDYDRVWPHRAPEGLRFKVEASAGVACEPSAKFVVSTDMLALLYPMLEGWANFNPYVEAGVGLVYTDFKRPGQGLSVNFHPVAGAGVEFDRYLVGVRLHHLSNSELHEDNKSMNYLTLQAGFYF